MQSVKIVTGDSREILRSIRSDSVDCCVTSPPYFGLRDYGVDGQMGLEQTPAQYVENLVGVLREVRRILKPAGTLWLNLGDSYAGSGRGGNPDAGTKQGTNKGSQTIGVLYGRDHESAETERARIKAQNAALLQSGCKPKDLIGIPWRVAFALQADGWYLRQDIIWAKPNPMPESVRDRCTKAHEYIFMLSKSQKYYYDADSVAEPLARPDEAVRKTPGKFGGANKFHEAKKQSRYHSGNEYRGTKTGTRNKRSVWFVSPKPFKEAHFATFPPDLIQPCILAGCPPGGIVLDPFAGSGTTGLVAADNQRLAVLIELNPKYVEIARRRLNGRCLP